MTHAGEPTLTLRPAAECRFDCASLGEVMLRFDPGAGRIRTTRQFQVYEGGGEYNVSRGLRKCFSMRTAIVTALPDNEVGRLVEDLMLQGGVDTSQVRWVPYDGIGHDSRVGLNFTERGFSVRGALGVSDRGHSAASQLAPGQVDWDGFFGQGVRWFHTGGIFAGLSDTTHQVALEAMTAAKRHGTRVSYDLNYRPSLWQSRGGIEAAQRINAELVRHVDVLFGNEEDFHQALGVSSDRHDPTYSQLPVQEYQAVLEDVGARFPNLEVVAATLRVVHSASVNDWGGMAWSASEGHVVAQARPDLLVFDRVGGGDSFAAGLIYGILEGLSLGDSVEYGAAHGALAMTTPGDTSMATLKEVQAMVKGVLPRVQR